MLVIKFFSYKKSIITNYYGRIFLNFNYHDKRNIRLCLSLSLSLFFSLRIRIKEIAAEQVRHDTVTCSISRRGEGRGEVVNKNVTRVSSREGVSCERPRDTSASVDL